MLPSWWVFAPPGVFLNTVGDIEILPKVLDAASRFDHGITQESQEAHLAQLSMIPLFV